MGFNNGYESGYEDAKAELMPRIKALEAQVAEAGQSGGSPDTGGSFDPADFYDPTELRMVDVSGLTGNDDETTDLSWDQDLSDQTGAFAVNVVVPGNKTVAIHFKFPDSVTRIIFFHNVDAMAFVQRWETVAGHEITRSGLAYEAGGVIGVSRVSPDTVAITLFRW